MDVKKLKERLQESNTDWLQYVLHVAILGGVVYAGFKYLNGEEILQALRDFDYGYAPFILGLSMIYFALKAWRFVLLMKPYRDQIPAWPIFKGYVAGQAATILPAGVAARAGLMKQLGVPVAESTVPVLVNSNMDQFVFLVTAIVASFFFAAARVPVLIAAGVVTLLLIVFLVPNSRQWILAQLTKLAEKLSLGEQWETFLDAVPPIFVWRIMLPTLALTILALAAQVVALDLAMRGVGLNVGYPQLTLAFVLGNFLGRLTPVPGGLGVTGAGMVGMLTATAGVNANVATAAVAIFRIATVFFNAAIGAIIYFLLWRGEDEVEREPAGEKATTEAEASV